MERTLSVKLPHQPTPKSIKVRTLAVDDNITNQTLIKHLLSRLGCVVDVASNGQEAIEMLAKEKFDVVFMDCHMPIMNGYDATEIIRKSSSINSDIPIIAVTADVIDGNRERCLESGMDDYITKPILPGVLEKSLNDWVRNNISSLSAG